MKRNINYKDIERQVKKVWANQIKSLGLGFDDDLINLYIDDRWTKLWNRHIKLLNKETNNSITFGQIANFKFQRDAKKNGNRESKRKQNVNKRRIEILSKQGTSKK